MFFSEGSTGVEPVTYQIATDCSNTTTELYTHVSLNIEYGILETRK